MGRRRPLRAAPWPMPNFCRCPLPLLLPALMLLLATAPARAQTSLAAAETKPAPLRPVRAGRTDSTYAGHYRQQRHLLDAIIRNQPLSWIAVGGEFARRHQTAANAPDTNPNYLFSAYLNTMFVVVSQPRFAFTGPHGVSTVTASRCNFARVAVVRRWIAEMKTR